MPSTVERVIASVEEVFRNKEADPPTLDARMRLSRQLGLDYAEPTNRLELESGRDPFQSRQLSELCFVADLAMLSERGASNGHANRPVLALHCSASLARPRCSTPGSGRRVSGARRLGVLAGSTW